MRIVLQRVSEASVDVGGEVVAQVGQGLLALVAFSGGDDADLPESKIWKTMQNKLCELRIFPDENEKLNLSLNDTGGELLLVSQFTLYADCKRGRRPSFHHAAGGDLASALFERFCDDMAAKLPGKVQRGVFGAHMKVKLLNDGPITIILDDKELG